MRMFDYNYIHPGFIFIHCPNMTPGGLRAQYLIPNLMPKHEFLSIHSSLPSVRATSPRDPVNPAQTVLLPNGSKLMTAGIPVESSEEIFPCWTRFVTKLGPQISLFPVPIACAPTWWHVHFLLVLRPTTLHLSHVRFATKQKKRIRKIQNYHRKILK
jgi:hypothetical protein